MPECSLVFLVSLTFCSTIKFNPYLPFEFLNLFIILYYIHAACKFYASKFAAKRCDMVNKNTLGVKKVGWHMHAVQSSYIGQLLK